MNFKVCQCCVYTLFLLLLLNDQSDPFIIILIININHIWFV